MNPIVKKLEKIQGSDFKHHIKADVIILGCSLPGIVAAHNLKKQFGDSVAVVLLDQAENQRSIMGPGIGLSVAFQDVTDIIEEGKSTEPAAKSSTTDEEAQTMVYDNVGRFFIERYSNEFNIPVPESVQPQILDPSLRKLFQDFYGNTAPCKQNYHEFDFLGYLDQFEILQYQTLLDCSMKNLFHNNTLGDESETNRLMYLDHITMETHLCEALTFSKSRDIMRTIVQLICGNSADKVSVLFYLRQCHRVSSSSNLIDGDNSRFRERLVGHFRRRLVKKLHLSVAGITLATKPIKEIRTSSDEQVILEPEIGETNYICDWLAMALNPEQLKNIAVESTLVSEEKLRCATDMESRASTKFIVEYEENFWQPLGYSGDILSLKGPIIWATERPLISKTRGSDKYVALIGYLKVKQDKQNSREEVIAQLVELFGEAAANPVSYIETPVKKTFIPRLGHFVGLRHMMLDSSPRYIVWTAMDIYAEGDIVGAMEGGHTAYVRLLSALRPQAVTYEDIACGVGPTNLYSSLSLFLASLNVMNISRYTLYGLSIVIALRFLRLALRNKS